MHMFQVYVCVVNLTSKFSNLLIVEKRAGSLVFIHPPVFTCLLKVTYATEPLGHQDMESDILL